MLPAKNDRTPLMRVLWLCVWFGAGLLLCSIILMLMGGEMDTRSVRITAVLQDLLVFIIPAAAVAVTCTRNPDRFLHVNRLHSLRMTLLAVLAMVCSIPLMDTIVAWNEGWVLPWPEVQKVFTDMEEAARGSMQVMLGEPTVSSLIVNLLIVAVLAGLSEELFFRGALQGSVFTRRPWLSVWVTAFLFSAFHFQMFGFVPRMLLGAFFGYLLLWSRSLWLPVLLHVLNNGIVIVSYYLNGNQEEPTTEWSLGRVLISAFLVGYCLFAMYKIRVKDEPRESVL